MNQVNKEYKNIAQISKNSHNGAVVLSVTYIQNILRIVLV